jgi:hypothetical protein
MLDALLADNPELADAGPAGAELRGRRRRGRGRGRPRAAGLLRKSAALLADDGSGPGASIACACARCCRVRDRRLPAQGRAMLLATAQDQAPENAAVAAAVTRAAGRPATAEDAAIARRGGLGAALIASGLLMLLGVGHLLRGAVARRRVVT